MGKVEEKAKRKNVYKYVAEQLLQDITAHVYSSGERLPSERLLAEKFSVSRTTIREAIRYLESIGCVETRIGAGSYVKALDMTHMAETFSNALFNGEIMNCDVIEVRFILDSEVGALAAARRTGEQLQALKDNISKMKESIELNEGVEAYAKYDEEFHMLLAKATNNIVLINLVGICASLYTYTVNLSFSVEGMPQTGVKQHEEIVKAVELRDVKKVRMLTRHHILRTLYRP